MIRNEYPNLDHPTMGDIGANGNANGDGAPKAKKQILLNAFDMSTVGHLSPGQWKVSSAIPPQSIYFNR